MATMVIFDIPETSILASLGRVAVRHGHLEYTLRMAVKSLTGKDVIIGLDLTKKFNVSRVREAIKKHAEATLNQCELDRLDDLLIRAKGLSDRRNTYLHGLWATNVDGGGKYLRDTRDHVQLPQPSVSELDALATEIGLLVGRINHARLDSDGFIALAVKRATQARAS